MRRILLLAAVLFAAVQVSAAPVDLSTAQAKAKNFIKEKIYNGKIMSSSAEDLRLLHLEKNSKDASMPVYYIFNTPSRFIIVSGDDRAEEILAYGDRPLDMNRIPVNMQNWLQCYKDAIEYLEADPTLTPSFKAPARAGVTVEPLLPCLWDQDAPYNNLCTINGYSCLTGCPATSLAQVFDFWKYPDGVDGVPGYRCTLSTGYYSTTTVNIDALPAIEFDWANILDTYKSGYNTAQATAVAQLMRYVGQAEHMEYGTSAAGGSGIHADSLHLLVNACLLFGYDEETVHFVKKTTDVSGSTIYTDAEWATMIQDELAEGRPIVFCAISSGWFGGGHAFNVDGYNANTNKYHINFGWSGDGNGDFALNAFDGYNQYQQMVLGIQPPVKTPRIKIATRDFAFECFKGETKTATFTVKGTNLEGPISLTLNDPDNAFAIDVTSVSIEEAEGGKDVTITYEPKAAGSYNATITCTTPNGKDVVITLAGNSPLEIYRPVMLAADESKVTATSFLAEWTDETPEENVVSYTLEVSSKPDVYLIDEADFSELPAMDGNQTANASQYLPEGWTFTGSHLYLDGGFISMARNEYVTAPCDLTGFNKVSVIVQGKSYKTGANTTLTVSTSLESQTITFGDEVDAYLVVLECEQEEDIKFIGGYYPEIQAIKIYGGEITNVDPFVLNAPAETGDAENRLITDITGKSYMVKNLTAGGTFLYRVKAHYINGTDSKWSASKEITLVGGEVMTGDVNNDGEVNIDDVTALIGYMLSGDTAAINIDNTDINGDGEINIDDVTALINLILQS